MTALHPHSRHRLRSHRHSCSEALRGLLQTRYRAPIVVVGYGICFWLLALVLKHLRVGTTYAIWSAVGTAAIALVGIAAYGEAANALKLASLGAHHARRDRAQCRRRALETASSTRPATVVRRDGAQALTLDAVATEAEVSKGGLLYHFKSKRDLVEGMVERWMAEFQREIEEADPAFIRGYVKASAPAGNELGMLAALVADPSLLVAVRRQYGIWQDRVEREGRDPVDATVARLAADGLWLAELLGMGPPTGSPPRPGIGATDKPGRTTGLTGQSTR